jgi:hypothetical protein
MTLPTTHFLNLANTAQSPYSQGFRYIGIIQRNCNELTISVLQVGSKWVKVGKSESLAIVKVFIVRGLQFFGFYPVGLT